MKNKILSILALLIVVCVGLFVISACSLKFEKSTKSVKYELNADGMSYTLTRADSGTEGDVVIPSRYNGLPVTAIGEDAFAERRKITSIYIPATVTSIGDWAFLDCESLAAITVDEKNEYYKSVDGNLYTKDGKMLVQYAIGKTDASFVVPEGVVEIGEEAFGYGYYIEELSLPSTLETIGFYAFSGCRFTQIYIPASVKEIADTAFSPCYYAEEYTVDPANAYYKSVDGNIYTKDGKTLIQYAIGKKDEIFVVPDGVTAIGEEAFADSMFLKEVTISEGVVSIDTYAFYDCSATKVALPSTLTTFGHAAFQLSAITSITIPEGVTRLEDYLFFWCEGLEEVYIPANVTSIGDSVFGNCTGLKRFVVDEDNRNYKSVDGNIYTKDGKTLVCYAANGPYTTYVVPDGVETVAEGAFSKCDNLTTIVFPEGFKNIEYWAFSACGPLEMILPASLEKFDKGNFYLSEPVTVYYEGAGSDLDKVDFGEEHPEFYADVTVNCYSATKPVETGNNWRYVNGMPVVWGYFTEGLEYSLNAAGDGYVVSGPGTATDTDLVIPETYEGLPVTGIGSFMLAFTRGTTSIYVPRTVTSIGRMVLYGCITCDSLEVDPENETFTSVDGVIYSKDMKTLVLVAPGIRSDLAIPEGVTRIEDYACENCIIYNVTLPSTLTYIGSNAFYACRYMRSINIPEGVTEIGELAFWNCRTLTELKLPSTLKTIGEGAFMYCEKVKEFVVPESVTTMGDSVFYSCYMLESVNIPLNITKINDMTFYYCYSLKTIDIREGITSIGSNAFSYCLGLTSVTIPASVTEIGDGAFGGCTSLTEIVVSNGNPAYKSVNGIIYTKDGKTLLLYPAGRTDTSIVIPDEVTTIGAGTFKDCTSIESITLPANLTEIGEGTFNGCTSLKSVVVPDKVTSIGRAAFEGCSSLETVVIGTGVETVGFEAFFRCGALKTLTFSASVKEIEDQSFYDCTQLKDVYYLGTVADWCGIEMGYSFGNPAYYAENLYIGGELLTDFAIPEGVKTVGFGSLHGYKKLKTVSIPASVTKISDMAFVQCESLIGFTVADGNENYKAVDGSLYTKDGKTLVQYAIGKANESFVVPDDVTDFAYGALAFSPNLKSIKMGDNVKIITELAACACPSLEYVVIGGGVEYIDSWAFSSCDKLSAIYYHGTGNAWSTIVFDASGDGYEWLDAATVYFYSETKPTAEGNFWHYEKGVPTIW